VLRWHTPQIGSPRLPITSVSSRQRPCSLDANQFARIHVLDSGRSVPRKAGTPRIHKRKILPTPSGQSLANVSRFTTTVAHSGSPGCSRGCRRSDIPSTFSRRTFSPFCPPAARVLLQATTPNPPVPRAGMALEAPLTRRGATGVGASGWVTATCSQPAAQIVAEQCGGLWTGAAGHHALVAWGRLGGMRLTVPRSGDEGGGDATRQTAGDLDRRG
jgi:hypothetical protein